MKKNNIPEGTIFMLPLRDDGYAVGVLARTSNKGPCFGYFFGPRIHSQNEIIYEELNSDKALLCGQFGDLELIRGNWPLVGTIPDWANNRWEMPPQARIDESSDKAWLSYYDDRLKFLGEKCITPEQAMQYPYDRLMGAGAVEIRLTKLLTRKAMVWTPPT